MRLSEVHVRNYRSLRDFSLSLDDYTVLVGANGSGKSSVLYALDWFFNGGKLDVQDLHARGGSESTARTEAPGDARIEVSVQFTDLSDDDREILGKYGKRYSLVQEIVE